MRLNRLDLSRYGIFTDYSLNFGERRPGAPDLHVVYGPNEAGKSTAFSAFLDLLFGIEPRSAYNFLHQYSTMRIGGSLEVAGAAREFARVKKAQNSLLDGHERPIADAVILGDLAGIDRAAYTTMFSLDDHTLEAGGESILESRGDLGQLLFAASAGLADLSRKLDGLRAEAEGFYKPRKRGLLTELKERLGELKKERERLDTLASEYARLLETRGRAKASYDQALEARTQVGARLAALNARSAALPKLAELRRIRSELEPLAAIPEAPAAWTEDLPALQEQETKLATQAEDADSEVAQLAAELETIAVDDRVVRLADAIERLADLRARHVAAQKDLPERRLQLRETDRAVASILTRIERFEDPDPGRLSLGASIVGALRDLMEKRSGIEARLAMAAEEASAAGRRLEGAKTKLAAAGGGGATVEIPRAAVIGLEVVLRAARGADHEVRRRLAARARAERAAELAERMLALRPWRGEADELLALCVPEPEDIERWRRTMETAQGEVERRCERIEALAAEQRRLAAERDGLSRAVGVVGDDEAVRLRAAREQAWAAHRRRLDSETADAFEAALRRDDLATSGRAAHAAEAAKLTEIARMLEATAADLEAERARRDAAARTVAALRTEIDAAVEAMTTALPRPLPLQRLEGWLEGRARALETYRALLAAERDLRAAEEDAHALRLRLAEVLAAVGLEFEPDADAERLVAHAEAAVERAAQLDRLRAESVEREREAEERTRALETAKAAASEWSRRWAEVCASCWLGERGSAPELSAVREVLEALDELEPVLTERAGLAERVERMAADQREFAAEAGRLAKALGLDREGPELDLAAALAKRLDETRRAELARDDLGKRLERARARRRAIAAQRSAHDLRKAEMIGHFAVGSLAEAGARLRDLESRRRLAQRAAAVECEILDALGVRTVAEAERLLDALGRAAVESEIDEAKRRFDDLDTDAQERYAEYKEAARRVDAVGGDDAVARIEARRRTTLLEIEDGATRYLRLRLGVAAAEQALRLYRDEHRSSMLARASEAFRVMSRGAYSGLATQPEKDREVLIAVAANGATKLAPALSKGTRFQLYVALRVAGYYEFVRSRPAVPFVADDILETFDDLRAAETFKLFAEMAEVGQVIYLTHHRHLCEIARRICPQVQVHELVSAPAAAAAGGA